MASKLIAYNDFSNGLNDTSAPDMLKDNELMEATNIDLSEIGGFSTRKGSIKFSDGNWQGEITQIIEWIIAGNKKTLIVINKKLYETNEQNINFHKADLNTDTIGYVIIQHKLYFSNGTELYEWGGYDYVASNTNVAVEIGEIVFNKPKSSGTGTEGRFYQSKTKLTTRNLSTENFLDTALWIDVTEVEGYISNVIRPVKPKTKDKTGATIVDNNLSPIKRCTMFCLHSKSLRIFASGDPKNPSALYFSEPGEINYFKGTNVLFPTNSEKNVTAITQLMNDILVSYNNSWWKFSGIDPAQDATWQRLALPYGCVSNNTIALTPYSMTFMGRDGIYNVSVAILAQEIGLLSNEKVIKNLSDGKVENVIKGITDYSKTHAIFNDDKYYLSFGDKILVYNWKTGGFTVYEGIKVNGFITTSTGDILIASTNYILKFGYGYTDIDVVTGLQKSINMRVKTKPYNFGYGINRKLLNSLYIITKQYRTQNSSISLSLTCDYVKKDFPLIDLAESLIWGRDWGKTWGINDLIEKEAEVKEIAIRFQVVIENNNFDDVVTIYGLGFNYKLLKPKSKSFGSERGLLE